MCSRKIRIISIFLLSFCFAHLANAGDKINKIIVEGNKRVEVSTIHSYLGVKSGEELTSEKQQKAIQDLYATSLFDDVKMHYSNGALYVVVKETPLVVKVIIKGNGKLGTKTLNKEILTKAGQSLRTREIEHDVNKITEMYKRSGRFAVKVSSSVENLENNRARVTFNIVEGPKTSVRKIRFIGNETYSPNQLKSIILTKETAWYRFLDTNDTYDPDRMEYDQVLLRQFYQSVGYADFRVLSANAQLSPTKDYFIITYAIDEGQRYKFGKIDIENNIAGVKISDLKRMVNIKSGGLFSVKKIEKIEDKITDWLGNKGYPQVVVHHAIARDSATHIAGVKIIVDKSDMAFIDKINITGNLKTKDKVIRREFAIAEGDLFNRSQLERAERNLRNLDYFEKINLDVKPSTTHSKYNIDLNVQEKSTSSIGLETGFNTMSGPFGKISFDDRNVVGTGKELNASMQLAKKSSSYTFGITEPYFMDKDLSLGTSLFYTHTGSSSSNDFWGESNAYTLNSKGGRVSLGYNLSDDLQHSVFYTIKKETLSVAKQQQSLFVQEQVGKYVTSAVGQSLRWNKVDNLYAPKNGYVLTGTQEYAGVGGDNAYLKHDANLTIYNSFIENKYTLKLSGDVGYIRGMKNQTVRINDRFSLGDYSMRGFAPRGIGPRDKRTGEALGGQKYYSATAELQFPIGMPQEFNLSGAIFADVGALWDFDIKKTPRGVRPLYIREDVYDTTEPRVSYGFGIIWNTRIAPIRIDYAFRLRKQQYDDVQPWHLKFSTAF